MIRTFDKATCRLLQEDLNTALADLAKRHGLAVRPAGGKFSDTSFTAKVEFTLAQNNPAAKEAEMREFNEYCSFYGLEPSHYGAQIPTQKYGPVTLIGFEIGRPKFPIKVRASDGSMKLFVREVIKSLQTFPTLSEGKLIEEDAP